MRRPITTPCRVDDCSSYAESRKSDLCRVHRYRLDKYGSTDDPRTERACTFCGRNFTPGRANSIVCDTQECRDQHYAASKRRYRAEGTTRPHTPKTTKQAPRVVTIADLFTRDEIGDRDNWTCQLCGDPVDPQLYGFDPEAGTLAHRQHLNAGGTHTRENCITAHLRCKRASGEPA